MKITLSYIDAEEREAAAGVLAAILALLPGVRVRKNASKPPYIHVHLTTRKAGNPCNSKKDA